MARVVVVTGATGYIATELVKQLLEKGYSVRGTARSLTDMSKVQHLHKLAEALPGTLTLHEADLLKEGSFDEVVKGSTYVFHTASPFIPKVDSPEKQLIEPAVKGTRNVMSSVVKAKDTVQRVVVTSSFAAMRSGARPLPPVQGQLYCDADWNESSQVEDEGYFVSKVQAEKAAWEVAEANGIDLVTIHPTFVFGPVLSSRTDATSVKLLKSYLEHEASSLPPRTADVRDVARAHILAVETTSAKGRYIVSQAAAFNPKEISDALAERFPHWSIPQGKDEPGEPMIDNSKVQLELGLQIRSVKESIVDMAVTLVQLGVANPGRRS